jgi:transketolase
VEHLMIFDKGPTDDMLRGLRRDIIDMAEASAHVGPALSCVEIITALYTTVMATHPNVPQTVDRNYFVLSKGHGCMALYAVLAMTGFLDRAHLPSYAKNGSFLAEHPLAGGKVPGVDFALGTLGHGLAVGAGMAKGLKLRRSRHRVFVLLGDGECDEGSVWEAVSAAGAQCLDNLVAMVDWNGYQACARCEDVSGRLHLPECWDAFGWHTEELDGHDLSMLRDCLMRPNPAGQPRVLFCRTVKGKGVDFMENNLEWHYRPVCGPERETALARLK